MSNTIDKRATFERKKLSQSCLWRVYNYFFVGMHVACCLIPVLTLVVLLVKLDDIDDISFSKRRYFLIVSQMSISVYNYTSDSL